MMDAYIRLSTTGKPAQPNAVVQVQSMVNRVVTDNLAFGAARAVAMASDVLCMGPRRTRGYYHREIIATLLNEVDNVRGAFRGYLLQRRADLAREDAEIAKWLERYDERTEQDQHS